MQGSGILFVIAAPSGAGKTTLVKALTDSQPGLKVSISHTTRPKRPSEIDGVNYHFIENDVFQAKIANHEFIEYAEIFGNFYGTSKTWLESQLRSGQDIILEIDWQGHQQLKKIFHNIVSIFILPPSLEDLRERLELRNQDNSAVIAERIADAKATIAHADEFDYVIINDDFIAALHDLRSVIRAQHLTLKAQQLRHPEFFHKKQ